MAVGIKTSPGGGAVHKTLTRVINIQLGWGELLTKMDQSQVSVDGQRGRLIDFISSNITQLLGARVK